MKWAKFLKNEHAIFDHFCTSTLGITKLQKKHRYICYLFKNLTYLRMKLNQIAIFIFVLSGHKNNMADFLYREKLIIKKKIGNVEEKKKERIYAWRITRSTNRFVIIIFNEMIYILINEIILDNYMYILIQILVLVNLIVIYLILG